MTGAFLSSEWTLEVMHVTTSQALVAIAVSWLFIGVALSLAMGRRGHQGFGWGVTGTVLGPLAVLFALDAVHQERREIPRRLAPGRPGGGSIDVVVGIDGSAESRAALVEVIGLLGSRLGRLTLATVIPFDGPSGADRLAEAELDRQARVVGAVPELELLHGRPADALGHFARDGRYHLLVIGTRGYGLSKAVLGSTARQLARRSPVPILIGNPEATSRFVDPHDVPTGRQGMLIAGNKSST